MKTKFKYPPISELVIGLYFNQLLASFRSEHVGLFWSLVRPDFPVIRQQPVLIPPIFAPMGTFIEFAVSDEAYPMPRFWLEGKDDSTLMQLQKNAFLFNWRKQDSQYPHYETVKAAFDFNFALPLCPMRKGRCGSPSAPGGRKTLPVTHSTPRLLSRRRHSSRSRTA